MTIVVVSGGFDPIHKGHIEYINKAKGLADKLICILNSDEFLMNKKGYAFQEFSERKVIMENIKAIDEVIDCIDTDQTVCKTLEMIKDLYPDDTIFFAKGGDRTMGNIPEYDTCIAAEIVVWDSLGFKIQSSSKLVERWKNICTDAKT